MQCYTQLVPPTAVNACVSLPFLSATANNLVVAKSSLLQVFSLKAVIRDKLSLTKLVLVGQYELPGIITALARVKAKSRSGGNLLLISLREAKLSLVEWDPDQYGISTISVHYFERDDVVSSLWDGDLSRYQTILSVDPGSRCAALKLGSRHLAIVPFHHAGLETGMDEVDGAVDSERTNAKLSNGTTETAPKAAPYVKSFVLSLLTLDPQLLHPIHLAFAYGYREPTLAILSSAVAPSSNLLDKRRDTLSYTVYTLDVEQRASTTLLSVTGLPYDLTRIVPLTSSAVGGSLLLGGNEIIHVDQSGKTNGIGVNEFATKCTAFPLVQQTGLDLRLEGCVVEPLASSNGDVLLITNDGTLFILAFQVDGRSVSALKLNAVPLEDGENLVRGTASCAANVGRGRVFVGSEDADSVVLAYVPKSMKLKRQQSRPNPNKEHSGVNGGLDQSEEEDGEDDDDDEDDLYGSAKPVETETASPSTPAGADNHDYTFYVHDSLVNLAPLGTPTLVSTSESSKEDHQKLYASVGRGSHGNLVQLSPFLDLQNLQFIELPDVDGVWPLCVRSEQDENDDVSHNIVIISKTSQEDAGESHVYHLKDGKCTGLEGSEFEASAGNTIEVATTMNGTRIVQVLKSEVRVFDQGELHLESLLRSRALITYPDFGLSQICPLSEDVSGYTPQVLTASFAEPYVLLLRDDATITVLKSDETGDLEELETTDSLKSSRWQSGCLYDDVKDVFRLESDDEEEGDPSSVLMFLLSEKGSLDIYQLPGLNAPLYSAPGLTFLPPFLSSDFNLRRAKDREEVVEVLVAEVGDVASKSPYLIIRSTGNDLTLYHPFQAPHSGESHPLRFVKLPHTFLPKASSDEEDDEETAGQGQRRPPLRVLPEFGGLSVVLMPGPSSSIILKQASGEPKILDLQLDNIKSIGAYSTPGCPGGLILVDETGKCQTGQLPMNADYSTGWIAKTPFQTDRAIDTFCHHSSSDHFVVAGATLVDFKLPHDELHPEWDLEVLHDHPTVEQGVIKLVDPATWTVSDTHELETGELVMSLISHDLELSQASHRRRPLIIVGTAILKGDDTAPQGRLYVFDVVEVVKDPESVRKAFKLKLLSEEETRGYVTTMSPVGSEGLIAVAQGQKCIVRGLTEDHSFLPVAALDIQTYTTVLKELPGSGLCMFGDAIKGLWFAGYRV